MQDVKNVLLSIGETYYANECFKRIYELDKADPAKQVDLEMNLSLQETFEKMLHIGGFRVVFDSAVDTTVGYIPPKKEEQKHNQPKERVEMVEVEDRL